ncbi:contractile injection system protein, VgrG/Pvc8 family [Sorangium sp. So ce1335]|uniref:contractile injection system protein, VgrG/Pvc8 family n=1 Tax=Sorangium sp. So ce1335 TaxID=3133335 RepID=UPI003F627F8A
MSDVDFAFAWEGASEAAGPWRHLQVVELRGSEAISSPYRYELVLAVHEPAPEVDPEELIGARATLRVTTRSEPAYRAVHGIITEAEELGPIHDVDSLGDEGAEAWMSRYSRLFDGTPDHGLEYITRGTNLGTEHYFATSVDHLLRWH